MSRGSLGRRRWSRTSLGSHFVLHFLKESSPPATLKLLPRISPSLGFNAVLACRPARLLLLNDTRHLWEETGRVPEREESPPGASSSGSL